MVKIQEEQERVRHMYLLEVEVFGVRKEKYSPVMQKQETILVQMLHYHPMGILP